MSEHHPRGLEPLTASSNALVESERENLDHQRNTMSDLANSLKTPLAVLRTRLDNDAREAELREDVDIQLRRLNDLVGYQLGRAASAGHKLFPTPLDTHTPAEQIVRRLDKNSADTAMISHFALNTTSPSIGQQ